MKIKTIILVILLTASSLATASDILKSNSSETTLSATRTIIQPANTWEHYPYNPPNTSISFPKDEGKHIPYSKYPKEWWYANFHLTGSSSGTEYGAFLAFFPAFHNYFFSISDLNLQKMYTILNFGIVKVCKYKLDLTFITPSNSCHWYTKLAGGELVPFQYTLTVKGKAREDKEIMGLDVDMHCLKPPMIIGGDGLVDIGNGWSYYYSQTKIMVAGSITLHGTTENVTGYAWIDHQWGNYNIGLPRNRVSWEWFSIKLDDFREIMVADTWWLDSGEYYGPSYDGLNLFNADYSLEILKNYKITPLDFWTDPLSKKEFAIGWRVTEPSKQINLTITADFPDQVLHVNRVVDLFFPLLVWEGSCSVSGTIEGKSVNGKAYVECSHSL